VHLIRFYVLRRAQSEGLEDRATIRRDRLRIVVDAAAEIQGGKGPRARSTLARSEGVRNAGGAQVAGEQEMGAGHTTFSRTFALK